MLGSRLMIFVIVYATYRINYIHMFFFVSIQCFLVLFQKRDDDDLEKGRGK